MILKNISNVVVYIDDIVVFGKTEEEHNEAVKSVLQKLSAAGLVLKKQKCKWNQTSIIFLGHQISSGGIAPLKAKVEAIEKIKAPFSVSQLRTFFGMVNYYHKFLPNPAAILEPLHQSEWITQVVKLPIFPYDGQICLNLSV